MFFFFLFMTVAVYGTIVMLSGGNPLGPLGLSLPPTVAWILIGILYYISIANWLIHHNDKKKGRKGKKEKQEGALPFERQFHCPYREKEIDDNITRYLEAEQLYAAGKRSEANKRWKKLGDANAYFAMGCYFAERRKFNDMLTNFEVAGEQGHRYAAFNAGLFYREMIVNGRWGENFGMTTKEYLDVHKRYFDVRWSGERMIRYFRYAAMQDLAEAQFNLAYLYRHGECVKQNIYLALYWAYRGTINQHGGCAKMLAEIYEELAARGDEQVKALLQKEAKRLRVWLEKHPEKTEGEEGVTTPHTHSFGPSYHEKYHRYEEVEHFRTFVKRVISRMPRSVIDKDFMNEDRSNRFEFDRYVLNIKSHWNIQGDYCISHHFPELKFKGKGDVTYGTWFTENKAQGVLGLKCKLEESFYTKFREMMKKDPYCTIVFEKVAERLLTVTKDRELKFGDIQLQFASKFVPVEVDASGINATKYVYIPPEPTPEPVRYAPAESTYESRDATPWWLEPFCSSGKAEYYSYDGSVERKLQQDVGNSCIYFDSAGNKFYSSDGTNFTKW